MAGSSSSSSAASSSSSSSSSNATTTRGLTAIEVERLENIKANQAVLASVGLGSTRRPGGSFHDDDDEAAAAARKKAQKRQKPPPRPPTEPTRRSSRNLGRDAPDYREDAIALSNLTSSSFTSSRHTWKAGEDEEGLGPGEEWDSSTTAAAATAAAAAGRVSATPGSSRVRDADVQFVLKEYLGKKVPYTGKQCVMDLLTPKGGGREGGPVKFSKYAGVVEWRNCVVLWVNVDGNDYENLWLEGGRRLTWFAGSRVKPETPVMVRLLVAGREGGREGGKEGEEGGKEEEKEGGKDAKSGSGNMASEKKKEGGEEEEGEREEKEGILLFCRRQGEPYVCMGRVWHVWFDTRTHPIKVLWKLRDWEGIKGEEDVREVVGEGGREGGKEEEEEGEEDVKGKGKKARVK